MACFLWGVAGFVVSLVAAALVAELASRPPSDDQTEPST